MIKVKYDSLFYIFLFLNVFCKGIGLDNDSKVYLVLLVIGLAMMAIKLLLDNYTKKEFLYILIIMLIGGVTMLFTKKPTLFLTCICISGMKNIDTEKVFDDMYKIRLITFFSVVFLALTGIIENTSLSMWRAGGFETRYSLGFNHPNSLHLALFILMALAIYVKYNNLKVLDYLLMSIINLFIFSYSGSRTGVILVFLLILLTILSKTKKADKLLVSIPNYLLIFLVLFSFFSAILYGKIELFNKLNYFLNGRILYSNYYLTHYNPTIFGVNMSGEEKLLFDNGYIYVFVQFGIAGMLLLLHWLITINKNIKKNKDVKRAVISTLFIIYIFTESFAPNIFMNVVLLFFGGYFFEKRSTKKVVV